MNNKKALFRASGQGGKRSLILGSETTDNPIGQTELQAQR